MPVSVFKSFCQLLVCLLILSGGATQALFAATFFTTCQSAASDADGDGWGWEQNKTCVVAGSDVEKKLATFPRCSPGTSDADGDGFGFENGRSCLIQIAGGGHPDCQRTDSDPDGDGFGWENGKTCLARNDKPKDHPDCVSKASDPDGDGFGWENGRTCIVVVGKELPVCLRADSDPDGDGFGWENGQTCLVKRGKDGDITLQDITDVVIVTGQSNVLAAETGTGFDTYLDQPNRRVFAYTDNGWQVADLYQVWDIFSSPGNNASSTPGRNPNNSFAFHFGKMVANKSNRIPAIIVAAAPGKGIAHWDKGSPFYVSMGNKIRSALQALPQKSRIDAVLWHQGENDWFYEGTADAGATGFTSKDSPEYRNYYQWKLAALIRNLRKESWGQPDMAFICGETRRADGVNRRLNALNTDNDAKTGCVAAADLPKRDDDPYGSHFSAIGLRALGGRYADEYLNMVAQ